MIDELVLMIGLFDDHHGVLDIGVGEIAAQRRLSVRRLVARRRRQAARLALDLFEQLRIACSLSTISIGYLDFTLHFLVAVDVLPASPAGLQFEACQVNNNNNNNNQTLHKSSDVID